MFSGSNPITGQRQGYRTYTFTFIDCNDAIPVFNIPRLDLSAVLNLKRVLPDIIAFCELLNAS